MESGYTYPERSANDYSFTAEVSRSHSKPATSCLSLKRVKAEASQKDEGLNDRDDRKGKASTLVFKAEPRKRTTYLRIGRKPKVKSKRSLINESI